MTTTKKEIGGLTIIYLVVACSAWDILEYIFDKKADVSFSGLILLVILIINVYTVFVAWFIRKREFFEEHPFRSVLLLMPSYLYLIFHLLALLTWGVMVFKKS